MQILATPSPVKPTVVFDTYWKFAAERQEIFFRRFRGEPPPWTRDSILTRHKFTNAYRAADRVSQYLIRNVIYKGDQSLDEIFFRCFVFKIFNRVSTWKLLEEKLGSVTFSEYSLRRYDEILAKAKGRGERIFSAAYIMPSHASGFNNASKHRNYLCLMEKMIADKLPTRLHEARSMAEAFELFRSYPLMGNFLAYQFATDINYSNITNFSEMDFVMPGPGAKDGIRKCFESVGDYTEADIIKFAADQQDKQFSRLGLNFRSLWGRPLQLIDCQNLFCEVDKYARQAHPEIRGITGRTRIKQKFTANSQIIQYWFPPKWKINDLIENPAEIARPQFDLFGN